MDIPPGPVRPRRAPRRGRVVLALSAIALTLVLSLFRATAVLYTDLLWFDSVHLSSVWSGLLGTKLVLGAISVVLFFVLFLVNLWVADRFAPRSLVVGNEDDLVRQWQRFVGPRAGRVRVGIAALLALIGGVGFSGHWQEWLLFLHGGRFGAEDPQFHKDLGFFVFTLPFLQTVAEWAFFALVFVLIVSLVAHYLRGAIRPQASHNRVTSVVKAHVSVLLALLAVVRAGQYYLERYELSYSRRGVVQGANYTDVHFLLPALGLLVLISLLAAAVFVGASRRRGWLLPVTTVALWGVVSVLLGAALPAVVQKLSVEPAETKKELAYIQRNIDATRTAMGIGGVEVHDFPYSPNLSGSEVSDNAQTVRNIRLWDPALVQPSYQRLQETRSFFKFDDVDVDRYPINGEATQMMLSVRELNPASLPSDRRSWVNEHLQYTHGYGAVASPANAVTSDGQPDFSLKDVPPTGTPAITRPQVYFGDQARTADYAIVGTGQPEVDFVSTSGQDQTSTYQGSGGVALDNVVKKAAFAARVGDINPLISGLVGAKSRAMYLTNIEDRARKAAPFLRFDADPYAVILDGRILWVQDAYTTTSQYPYGQPADTSLVGSQSDLKGGGFNYVRNSVKVVTDAYDGTMHFYVVDDHDPLVKAWRGAFPKLFTDAAAMPSGLREHLRYPEDLFRVQSQMFGKYHQTKAIDYYRQSDRWNIAQEPPRSPQDTSTTTAPPIVAGSAPVIQNEPRIDPYYLLMRLPNEQDESFILFQPFVPYSDRDQRKELSAFLTAKSDPGSYGQLDAFVMPRDQQVNGPALVDARINQEPSISQQITLLSKSGSSVNFGDMLIIPIDNSLLYVRPLYVTAQQTQVPEFKKAIVVLGDKIAMEDTLQQALADIFGTAPGTREQAKTPAPTVNGSTTPTTSPSPGQLSPDAKALLDQAASEYAQADAALKNGDLAGYQQHVRAMSDLLSRARGG